MSNDKSYKPYIDGLRAISIFAVVLFHTFPTFLPGGYVGVDYFFVISGFLITSILLKEMTTEIFSIENFYLRRVKRLFPALILVLITCYLAGWILFTTNEFKELNEYILYSSLFSTNFRLMFDVDYFQSSSEMKPLLHLWSLSIEMQFYLVWPIFLYWANRKQKVFISVLIFTLISLSLCLLAQFCDKTINFYAPVTRFWEISSGAIVAIMIHANQKNLVTRLSSNIFYMAILGMVIPLFFYDGNTVFPGFTTLLPVLSFVLVLLYLENNNHSFVHSFLCKTPIILLGKISYPLYLWHWVLLAFAKIIYGSLSALLVWIIIICSLIFAFFTHLCLERKIAKFKIKYTYVLIFVMLIIIITSYSAYKRNGLEFRYQKLIPIPEEHIRDLTRWEDKNMQPEGDCPYPFYFPKKRICVDDQKSKMSDTIVFGDSHAFSAFWGLSEVLSNQGHIVSLSGKGACMPYFDFSLNSKQDRCVANINEQLLFIKNNKHIKNIIFVHRYAYLNNQGAYADEQLKIAMFKTMDLLKDKNIIFIMPVPELRINPRLCIGAMPYGRSRLDNKCVYDLDNEISNQTRMRSLIMEVLSFKPEIQVYEPSNFICKSGQCSALVDGYLVFMDDNHLSESGSRLQAYDLVKRIKFFK